MFHYEKGEIAPSQQQQQQNRNQSEKLIAERKNLDRKLDNLKEEDYKRVLANLQGQNTKLKEELQALSAKVSHLIEKRKMEKKQSNKLVESQIEQAKKELEQTYKVVDQYKREVHRLAQKQLDEGLRDQYATYNNKEANINEEMASLKQEKKTLQQQIDRNMEVVREYTDEVKYDAGKFEQIANQNKEMRRRLLQSKKLLSQKDKESQEVVDKMFTLKLEHRKRMSLQNQASESSIAAEPIKKTEVADVSALRKQVDDLKQRKSEMEDQLGKEKTDAEGRRAKIEKKIRQSLQVQKNLTREKTKASNKLNMYESTEKRLEAVNRNESVPELLFEQRAVQTEKEVAYEFRRDWAGKIAKLYCDDRLIVGPNRQHSYVKKLTVYMQAETICAVRFGYSVQGAEYTTQIPIDQNLLKKLAVRVFQAQNQSFVQSLRIGLRENQIVRLEVGDNTGERLAVGAEPEGTVYYQLDIRSDERPLTMFQSFQYLGKDKYVLQSLGCQIADQP